MRKEILPPWPVIKSKINLSSIGNFYFGDEGCTFAEGNDIRFSDSRTPTGSAGGDLTGTYPNPILKTTGIAPDTYGNSTHVAQITVDAKGRLSLASSVAIAFPPDYISSVSDTNSIDLTVSSSTLSADIKKQNSTSINLSIDASGLKAIRNALTGDITAPSDSNVTTLATVNSNVGVFGSATQVPVITVNGKGLITAVSNTTITPVATSITGGQALSKTDDTNITLTLGGSPTTSLLSTTSLTLGWTGTLAAARLNSNVVQGITNDTNITGSISTQNLTFAWSGTLSDARLSTTAVAAASYGSASQIPSYTVSATGRLTAAANVAIQIAESQVTNLVSDLAAKQSSTLANTHLLVGNASNVATDVTLSGDATLGNTGALTLATVNATTGTFGSSTQVPQVVVNAKGLITSISNVTISLPVSASYQATPSDPSSTISSTGVMMGLVGSITPTTTGKLAIIISGNVSNTVSGSGAQVQIRYGTGTAPINGAALTGTAVGNISKTVNPLLSLLAPGSGNFNCNAIVSSLTPNTAYWMDVSLARITAGTAAITNISISVMEL